MSTRARIGRLQADGSVTSIYLHWDGYPDGAGKTLLDSWAHPDMVDQLLALGDVSSLGDDVGRAHDFESHNNNPEAKTWCLFYARDRGESDVAAINHSANEWPDYGQEYEYLFTPDGWKVRASYPHPSLGAGWVRLIDVLERSAAL